MRFAEIFKTELFSKYGQKAGCYINEIYDKHIDNFKEYRAYIGEERERFTRDVKKMIINMKNIEYEN